MAVLPNLDSHKQCLSSSRGSAFKKSVRTHLYYSEKKSMKLAMSSTSVRNAARDQDEQENEEETSRRSWLRDYLRKTDVPALFTMGFLRFD